MTVLLYHTCCLHMALPRGKAGSCFGLFEGLFSRPLSSSASWAEEGRRGGGAEEAGEGVGTGHLVRATATSPMGLVKKTRRWPVSPSHKYYSTTITPEKINIPSYDTVLQVSTSL